MIFLAAWSCFLVKKVPLTSQTAVLDECEGECGHPAGSAGELLPDFGVGGASGGLFQTLELFVAAVVLLDEDRRSATLLETLLLVVRPEL